MNVFIPDLVVPTGTGEVRLNASIEKELRDYKARTRAKIAAFHREYPETPAGNDMGIMCPALVRDAGPAKRHDVIYARFTGEYPPTRGLLRRFFQKINGSSLSE